ncbi:hypothetical protein X798_07610 [Onchocerca flexuosa]|uniref:Uncharacterized protein n=1 Tax=Onchocerca flexuosa TaxID=387005 RepID=A0A238BIV3_9BILA|nr:hypothetical protein X798_07610 [Onchocerca flexuosa]
MLNDQNLEVLPTLSASSTMNTTEPYANFDDNETSDRESLKATDLAASFGCSDSEAKLSNMTSGTYVG